MSAVTLTKIDVVGYGDEARYEVSFLGDLIGQVYKITESVNTNTGPSRIGRFVNRTRWYHESPERRSMSYDIGSHTRYEAISQLLQIKLYPGRPQVADRLAKAARWASE